jgi:DNA-binding HxlR family transcriptional regulator
MAASAAAKSAAVQIVGERWTLLILRDAMFRGHVRYAQFAQSLGVSTNILAKRLETLVAFGVLDRSGGEARGEPKE